MIIKDTAVPTTLLAVDSEGNIVEEKLGLGMEF